MTRLDFALIALVCLVILGIALCARAESKQAYVVCSGRCLESVTFGPHAELVTPMVNGKPDYSKAVMRGTIVKYDSNLEKIELR